MSLHAQFSWFCGLEADNQDLVSMLADQFFLHVDMDTEFSTPFFGGNALVGCLPHHSN